MVDLSSLLDDLSDRVKEELASMPDVVDKGHELDVEKLPKQKREWHKLRDVVAVVVDLKSSTQLGTGKRDRSTASIYDAATGGAVEILDKFDANFLQIQGDGVVGLFWGDLRLNRAMCAAVTVSTFSRDLVEQLESKWEALAEVSTGYKVGVASHRVLAKIVGTPRNLAQQEPIWAGKPVNFAAKAAQSVDRNEVAVTGSVWDSVEKNDYLAFSCPCGDGPSGNIWSDFQITKLPEDEPEAGGRKLTVPWCSTHGAEYCEHIMSGKTRRNDVSDLRREQTKAQMSTAIQRRAKQRREARRASWEGRR